MFKNRKLKLELMEALDSNERLRKELKEIRENYSSLSDQIAKADRELKAVKENYADCEKELEEVKQKVRAQNEADLMFVSAKIIKELLKGKKLAELTDHRKLLRTQAQAYQSYQGTAGPAYGAISDLLQSCGL